MTDADCAGLFGPDSLLLPKPYCVMGQCTSCLGGICPQAECDQDSDCVSPVSPPGVAVCPAPFRVCGCLSDLQCSGLWPKCLGLDAGYTNDAGLPVGVCGCDQDSQCGDAGWICLGSCLVPCSAPEAPACSSVYSEPGWASEGPICDPSTGLCRSCRSDQECQADPASNGPHCSFGICVCMSDSDCPANWTCQAALNSAPVSAAICVPSLARCTPESCNGSFCDWETGECLDAGRFSYLFGRACLTDYDCGTGSFVGGTYFAGSFCDPTSHICGMCNTNADCSTVPDAGGFRCFKGDAGKSSCGCLSDSDCVSLAVVQGPHCIGADGGEPGGCGCSSDVDCDGNPAGSVCETPLSNGTSHACGCRVPSDCQPGQACLAHSFDLPFFTCGTGCAADSDCSAGYACDPSNTCRARCDKQACPAAQPACDTTNSAGQNGSTAAGLESGATWCYQCLAPADCESSGCDSRSHQCGSCQIDSDCPAGDPCEGEGQCLATCDAGPCPAGQICDTDNLTGGGAYVCHGCLGPIDCPNGEGCSYFTLTCGVCNGPNASPYPVFDCPPGDICSNYWSGSYEPGGVCLASCDLISCPADRPICAVLPALTPDHKYCFGCLQDSDCASLGANAWCDVSVNLTFTCQVAP